MLSTLWELILIDLKGKENLRRDSRWVVTQRKPAFLMQALIKYQRKALAVLALQGGDSQPKLLSDGSGHHHWQSLQKHGVCSTPGAEALHSLHHLSPLWILWAGRNHSLLTYSLSSHMHTHTPTPLAERKALFEVSQILLFSFFFSSLREILNVQVFLSKQTFAIIKEYSTLR